MFRKHWITLCVFAVCLVCSVSVLAQNQGATRGNMTGTVLDPSKAVVPDAVVTITGPLGNQTQNTNAQGVFVFHDLIPGDYSVNVQKTGFSKTVLPTVQVLINNTATVNVTLNPGSVETTVEVSGASQAIDTTNSSVNTNLDDTFYNNVPVKRNVSAVMMLAPGAVSGLGTGNMSAFTSMSGNAATYANPSISGASGLENLYVADGVILNDPSYGGFGGFSTIYGALGSGITPAFVKEVEVKTAAFEPQFGHSTGGVVQIVTKSGGKQIHGTVGGYFQPQSFEADFQNKDNFNPVNQTGIHHNNADYEGDFELGGYVPGPFKNHLFYFGAFNPTFFHNYVSPASRSGLFQTNPDYDRRTDTYSYAGKLTYQVTDRLMLESSAFGDPAKTNAVPWGTLSAANTSGNSRWNYGTRNWDTRVQTTLSPSWTMDLAYTYAWNHFTETPADTTIFPIADNTNITSLGAFQAQGLAAPIVNYRSTAQAVNFDTSKIFRFVGNHTMSVGYFWQNPRYDGITSYSTPRYVIPSVNATGGNPGTAQGAGKTSDAQLVLLDAINAPGGASCTLCPIMDVPGLGPTPVVLQQTRGRFDSGVSANFGKYHSAYVNDAWELSRYATLDLGLRWEQQRLEGSASKAMFNDQWSPRIGFIVDPTGDRKSKIYTQFSRLAFVLPLDMAVRELSSEDDNLNEYWAPASDASGDVTLDKYGTVNFVPDAAHLLNNATGGISAPANLSLQANGEPFVPGVRMEYNDEFVVGAEHEFHGGFHGSVRYVDRRMKRVVEDQVGASVEQLTALAFNGGSYSYVIGNPSATETIFVSPNEQTFSLGNQWGGKAALAAAQAAPSAATTAALLASGYPAACIDANNIPTPFNAPNMQSSLGSVAGTYVGSACFPTVNSQANAIFDATTGAYDLPNPAGLYGGEYFPHGCQYCKPVYPNAQRNYQAVEFEMNKSFGNNWQMVANFRVGHLVGNYEGAFRNDNSQSDPGISSLFDLTSGSLGLLGQQLGIGPLNTDRKYVLNIYPSYTVPRNFAKNLTLGVGVNVESGVPLTTLAAQEIYGNAGEVPINGRGDLGRSPVVGTVDVHAEYPVKFGESKQLKFGFDAFNIANMRRSILSTQDVDLSFGVPNLDFQNHVPITFSEPFSARLSAAFTF